MADQTTRIEAANSFHEPESQLPSGRQKGKSRPRPKPLGTREDAAAVLGAGEVDEQDNHELDTVA
jgi:hypothetical protein